MLGSVERMDGREEDSRSPEDVKLDEGRAEERYDDADGSSAEDAGDRVPASRSSGK